jgi:hypothetical protein
MKVKKIAHTALTALLLSQLSATISIAAPTNDTNLGLDINRSVLTTFTNTGGLFDGVIDSSEKFSALTGDIAKFIQQVAVPLKNPAYLREIKVYWDLKANTEDYQLQYSRDGRKWFNLNRSKVTKDPKSIIHVFDGAGHSAKGLRIQIPTDKTKPGVQYRIQEVEIFPNIETRNQIRETKVLVLADTEAILQINSTIDGDKTVDLIPAQGKNAKPVSFVSYDPNEAVRLSLEPNQSYTLVAKVLDFNRNWVQSDRQTLRSEKTNLALGKKVSGTFNANPNDSGYVFSEDSQNRITDAGFDYFTQSATSGSVYQGDQFFTIDLNQSTAIRKVVLYWRGLSFPNQYQVLVSDDNQQWKLSKDKLDASKGAYCMVAGKGQLIPAQVQQIDLNGVRGRYVKVLIPKDAQLTNLHSNWEFVQLLEAKVF